MQKVAFILIGGGAVAALGFFLEWFFTLPLISLGFRIAVAVVIIGLLILLASVIRERYQAAREEKFDKEVKH